MPIVFLAGMPIVFLAAGARAAPLACGVATNQFSLSPPTLTSALKTGKLSFWWNWNTSPNLDDQAFSAAAVAASQRSFVPMVWGAAMPADFSFLSDAEGHVMGFNEPDLYGPACCNCDGKQSYYPATSSGWAPLFNPVSAAQQWRDTVNALANFTAGSNAVHRIVSPAMANGATPAAGVDCSADPAGAGNPKRCEGWLSLFKRAALGLSCARLDGGATNCWDVIDVLQIHAYAKSADEVLAKVRSYGTAFADDFAGTGGRSAKELWLTEVAAGSSDAAVIVPFVTKLMSPAGGLADRTAFGYLARVSWFSEWSFPAFDVAGAAARPNEAWQSSLFDPFGGLSPLGDVFFENCASAP